MNTRFQNLYMDFARRVSEMSRAERLRVGCVIVKDDTVVYGYNGTPAGWDNACEVKEWCRAGGWLAPEEIESQWPYEGTYTDVDGNIMHGRYRLKSKPDVLHAESNALMKMARGSVPAYGADLFVTHSPCLECAKMIYQAGIKRVYFSTAYRDPAGIDFLTKSGISVDQIE